MKVYLKNLTKNWKGGIFPPMIVVVIIPLIASIWPELKKAAPVFQEILSNPVYEAFLGQLGIIDVTQWIGMFYMYLFIWLEFIMVALMIIQPAKWITREVDKKTLDMSLSLPIPRWRYLLEKFMVFLTYNLLYPILLLLFTFLTTTALGETMDYLIVFYSLVGVWMQFFALGAIALLCRTIFLEARKAMALSAAAILGMWIIIRVGSMVESVKALKYLSIWNYMNAADIYNTQAFPVGDFFILLGIGIAALIGALVIFQKRELTY